MPEPAWTLAAVFLGSLLSVVTTLVLERYKEHSEEQRAELERQRASLSQVMDNVLSVMETKRVLITEAALHSHTKANVYEFDKAATRLIVQVIDLNDRPLQDAVLAWAGEVQRQTYATTHNHTVPPPEQEAHAGRLFTDMLGHLTRVRATLQPARTLLPKLRRKRTKNPNLVNRKAAS